MLSVWLAAEKVYPGVKFESYGILGDDVVITDPNVAPVYRSILEKLGLTISESKSLISENGSIEFAKKFLVSCGERDFSPISLRCLQNYYHPLMAYLPFT